MGRSTGLKDKNGELIYEGDVVLTDEAGWKGKVVYDDKCAAFMVVDLDGGIGYSVLGNWNKFEIVGNIYENPKLLKE